MDLTVLDQFACYYCFYSTYLLLLLLLLLLLGNYVAAIEQPLADCERRNVTICVVSQAALSKCLDMQKVAYSRGIRPDIRCHNPGDSSEACVQAINSKQADVTILSANDLYNASK